MNNLELAYKRSLSNIGSADYIIDGKPGDIIAHLYVIEGGELSDMEEWVDDFGGSLTITDVIEQFDPEIFRDMDVDLLESIQRAFDIHDDIELEALIFNRITR